MPDQLTLIGYFPKRRTPRPDWLAAPAVREICSVSGCMAEPPVGWIDHWAHNGLWVYDTPQLARSVVPADQAEQFALFAYRLVPRVYRDGESVPFDVSGVRPAPLPAAFESLGFDAVSRSVGTSFECSPLSCCNLAAELGANQWCLFDTLQGATAAAVAFSLKPPEPGPYVVIEVLRQRAA